MKTFSQLKKAVAGVATGLALFGAGVYVTSSATQVSANTTNNLKTGDVNLNVKSAIAIDAKTGQVLYAKNANEKRETASMSKLMTLYLVLDAIDNKKLSWDQKISPSAGAVKVSQNTNYSNVPLKADHEYTVRDLYRATVIYSANGAAMALADQIGGTQQKFIDMMRAEAKKMGIKDAEFYTANGLNNGDVEQDKYKGAPDSATNKMSANDVALLSQKLIQDHPEVLKTTSIKEAKFDNGDTKTDMPNWNWMLKGLTKSYSALPVDGLKTGTSDTAGANFAATVHKDGHRVITVVMGARHQNDQDTARFEETQKLMSYVYNNYTYTNVKSGLNFKKDSQLPVYHGKDLTIPTKTSKGTHIWLEKGVDVDSVTGKVSGNKKLYKKNGLEAPIKKGQKVGSYKLTVKGQETPFVNGSNGFKTQAVASQADKKANIFVIGWRAVKGLF
ncbi:D-alanyl-D-alanine carboxypeptidase [Ligilactobacillus acidipiscis DSM 15836]|uniref:serine-type D-Ala-D-Ala carboxypeptidase n=1 Tax=Ligilactobacillus acidipiscis DSM 15836 TaxID=1423716 RepID=A0ABR5PI98_9LACO|nr:serine hydrolase [Ligilactobacillus acidipiscis]KRM25203.1 D-alanyl-D-alanine carboxypeptidase [Ligilactobacillus acidipiscis DSM 15836]GAW63190.1 D-alanyl-D-alanine carboxypeptidase [Ligilactobacillus acidipiscis]GEN21621.1 D-alanyl-D-alanine carboxypeptidase [Ligilactobacillus acidipiscis]